MLVAFFGLATIKLPDWDALSKYQDQSRNDRRKFACGMRDTVEACLQLCDHADNVNHKVNAKSKKPPTRIELVLRIPQSSRTFCPVDP